MAVGEQLELFGARGARGRDDAAGEHPLDAGEPGSPEQLAHEMRARWLSERLPAHVRLGTSSWSFPGWAGLVYRGAPGERQLAASGLAEYARFPLFGTVGVDRSFYRPLDEDSWRAYARQLPEGFACVIKAWGELTQPRRARSSLPNPRFLDGRALEAEFLGPLRRGFAEHVGAVVLEFSPMTRAEHGGPARFQERLARFLGALPRDLSFAVELRNRELFTQRYLDVLRDHGVGHVLNFWERMPTVGEQLDMPGVFTADTVVARLLIPPGRRYAEQRAAFAPFDRLVAPQPSMRDDVVRLASAAAQLHKQVLVVVNNKAEGSSPLTVLALAERLVAAAVHPVVRPG